MRVARRSSTVGIRRLLAATLWWWTAVVVVLDGTFDFGPRPNRVITTAAAAFTVPTRRISFPTRHPFPTTTTTTTAWNHRHRQTPQPARTACSCHVTHPEEAQETLESTTTTRKSSNNPHNLRHKYPWTIRLWSITTPTTRMSQQQQEEKEQEQTVWLQCMPLIGGPEWLPVHVRVLIEVQQQQPQQPLTMAVPFFLDKPKDHPPPPPRPRQSHVWWWDFVPHNATQPQTLQRLIQGQSVPGWVRSNQDPDDTTNMPVLVHRAHQYSQWYDKDLNLLTNNCWTFASQLLWHLYVEPPQDEQTEPPPLLDQ